MGWILSQAFDNYSWPSDDITTAVVALASAETDWPAKSDQVANLIVKQLEIELLQKLLRLVQYKRKLDILHVFWVDISQERRYNAFVICFNYRRDIEALTPAKVAFFALAVGAACKDPHNFYGHNLIGE